MPANYVLLERIELNASAASVTFSNIPQSGYTDLKVVLSTRSTRTGYPADDIIVQFNGVTTGYSGRTIRVSPTSVVSSSTETIITGFASDADQTANTFGSAELYIPNYAGSAYKSVSFDSVTENNATAAPAEIVAGLWSNTAAITSMAFSLSVGSFVQYSTFSLYGLAALGTTPVIAPKASGGNITTDGTYWYHTFLSSGTFTPQTALSCDTLVIAGGAGGGDNTGGGGGAGGLLVQSGRAVTAAAYSITVGAGGAGGTGGVNSGRGVTGSNSIFDTITALGGGGGNQGPFASGANGGSGGGGGEAQAGGSATQGNSGGATGYGNAGGGGNNASPYRHGGGGGSGAAGAGGTGISNGNGGNGLNGSTVALLNSMGAATSTGVLNTGNYYYAAGGGGGANSGAGGTGGIGGGGNGGTGGASTAGTANTGSGGGGGGGGAPSAGGSGIVIIRYTIA